MSWHIIVLLCGRDQCGLIAHSVDLNSMRIESWSIVDRPFVSILALAALYAKVISPDNNTHYNHDC